MKFETSQSNTVAATLPAKTGIRNRFRVVSMFSGCGGMDLGFTGGYTYRGERFPRTKFDIVSAYDINERCVETYIFNIGNQVHAADLRTTDPRDIPAADVLVGGFPCQEFSICGPRNGIRSSRGQLYTALVRYAAQHQPKVLVAENVEHFLRINDGHDFRRVSKALRSCGYQMQYWKLFAPDYGVPQARSRIFLIGVRDDITGSIPAPIPTFASKYRSTEWAIADLRGVTDESVPNQSEYFRAMFAKSGHGQGDEINPRDRPAYTIRANAKSRIQLHYDLPRRLTIRECARLQTFPDTFIFPHPPTTSIAQIGNAVPPLLASVVAAQVSQFLSRTRND